MILFSGTEVPPFDMKIGKFPYCWAGRDRKLPPSSWCVGESPGSLSKRALITRLDSFLESSTKPQPLGQTKIYDRVDFVLWGEELKLTDLTFTAPPVFVVSRGRPDLDTLKQFDNIKDRHIFFVVIEEDFEEYSAVNKNVHYIIPVPDAKQFGVSFARNTAIDIGEYLLSIEKNVPWIWILDDNIQQFFKISCTGEEKISFLEALKLVEDDAFPRDRFACISFQKRGHHSKHRKGNCQKLFELAPAKCIFFLNLKLIGPLRFDIMENVGEDFVFFYDLMTQNMEEHGEICRVCRFHSFRQEAKQRWWLRC